MRKIALCFFCLTLVLTVSCRKKKYTEVVEVPLPAKEDKVSIGLPEDVKANGGPFDIVKLNYKYDALAPDIDAMTMEIHYSRHYLTYTNNLNNLVKGTPNEALTIEEILKKNDGNTDLRNNAGGYYNHGLYFDIIGPKAGGQPKDTLAAAINRDFGSFEAFKTQLTDVAVKQFGSGWAWVVTDANGKLQLVSTANQDNPLMPNQPVKGQPILGIDVWEHAYYLNYQNRRKKYVEAFFNVVNWKKVGEKYEEAIKK